MALPYLVARSAWPARLLALPLLALGLSFPGRPALAAGPAAEPPKEETAADPSLAKKIRSIAVLSLPAPSNASKTAFIMSDLLASELYSAEKFQVMERREALNFLVFLGVPLPAARPNGKAAKTFGRALRVEGLCVVRVEKANLPQTVDEGDPLMSLDLALYETAEGRLTWAKKMQVRESQFAYPVSASLFALAREAVDAAVKTLVDEVPLRKISLQKVMWESTRGLVLPPEETPSLQPYGSVAVLTTAGSGEEAMASTLVADDAAQQLEATKKVAVMDRAETQRRLQAAKIEIPRVLDPSLLPQIVKALNVGAVLAVHGDARGRTDAGGPAVLLELFDAKAAALAWSVWVEAPDSRPGHWGSFGATQLASRRALGDLAEKLPPPASALAAAPWNEEPPEAQKPKLKLRGRLFEDKNGDGKFDEGEPIFEDVLVRASRENFARSGKDGIFALADLSEGHLDLDLVDLPPGYVPAQDPALSLGAQPETTFDIALRPSRSKNLGKRLLVELPDRRLATAIELQSAKVPLTAFSIGLPLAAEDQAAIERLATETTKSSNALLLVWAYAPSKGDPKRAARQASMGVASLRRFLVEKFKVPPKSVVVEVFSPPKGDLGNRIELRLTSVRGIF